MDWSPIREQQPQLKSATVSFEITSQGEMANIRIDELNGNKQAHAEAVAKLSQQNFIATAENFSARPVKFKTTIALN